MFSFFLRREMTCFAVMWTTWAYDDKCSILSSYLKSAGSNLISRTVRIHFANIMTLNNWEMIAETRSYIFRWRSCFCRHLVCLSSLIYWGSWGSKKSAKIAPIAICRKKNRFKLLSCDMIAHDGKVINLAPSLLNHRLETRSKAIKANRTKKWENRVDFALYFMVHCSNGDCAGHKRIQEVTVPLNQWCGSSAWSSCGHAHCPPTAAWATEDLTRKMCKGSAFS